MRYARERLADISGEISPLIERHYAELGQSDMTLDPDWERILALEALGVMVTYTVRDDARVLIGYACYLVQPHLHYRTETVAINDVIWVAPERRGRIGLRLVRLVEIGLAALGVVKIYYHVKLAHPALGRVLVHLGYAEQETMLSRRIG